MVANSSLPATSLGIRSLVRTSVTAHCWSTPTGASPRTAALDGALDDAIARSLSTGSSPIVTDQSSIARPVLATLGPRRRLQAVGWGGQHDEVDFPVLLPHSRRVCSPTGRRRRSAAQAGVSLVEFALVAPLLFVLVLGLVVGGIVVTNQVQLTNAVRDGARAAGVCGSDTSGATKLPPYSSNPADEVCSAANVVKYTRSRLQAVPATVNLSVSVFVNGTFAGNSLSSCQPGATVEVQGSFPQPLYLPLIGVLLGDNGSNVRTIRADAEATCEQ